MKAWLLLTYRVPREPTSGRVYVWRKLKHLGAVSLQDAVWVLPQLPRTQEQFQWLATEIAELGGEATLFEADQLYATDVGSLRRHFVDAIEVEYRQIQMALRKKDRDLADLSRRYQNALARDYFDSDLGRQTREKLLAFGEGA